MRANRPGDWLSPRAGCLLFVVDDPAGDGSAVGLLLGCGSFRRGRFLRIDTVSPPLHPLQLHRSQIDRLIVAPFGRLRNRDQTRAGRDSPVRRSLCAELILTWRNVVETERAVRFHLAMAGMPARPCVVFVDERLMGLLRGSCVRVWILDGYCFTGLTNNPGVSNTSSLRPSGISGTVTDWLASAITSPGKNSPSFGRS